MTRFYNKASLLARVTRLAGVTIALSFALHAQSYQEEHATSPASVPYALLENSTIVGSGNTISATQIPVVLSSGTVYVNLKFQFEVDAKGNITIAPGYPQTSASPRPQVSSFSAGTYIGPSTIQSGNALITVSGPGVTSGGATEWSLSSPAGSNLCTYPSTANWYVGPIASNPWAARIKKAGITSTAWSYGIGSAQCVSDNTWGNNTLIGVSQIGNTLTIVSFTPYGSSTDSNIPVDQITYTLKH